MLHLLIVDVIRIHPALHENKEQTVAFISHWQGLCETHRVSDPGCFSDCTENMMGYINNYFMLLVSSNWGEGKSTADEQTKK